MLEFNYYVITSYVNGFPFFTTCAYVDGVYFRISNLELFLADGKSGVSDEIVQPINYKLVTSKYFTI
ncbi:hypothetical protein [Flavobacterium faecale]|uniref:hypothetical protein n=1 Tax=Flavobacterium faecale TaxID=1355330 RepID=UPI003AAC785C